ICFSRVSAPSTPSLRRKVSPGITDWSLFSIALPTIWPFAVRTNGKNIDQTTETAINPETNSLMYKCFLWRPKCYFNFERRDLSNSSSGRGELSFWNAPDGSFLQLHEFPFRIRPVFLLQKASIPVILIRENATYACTLS